jgi:hypothetical protein
VKRERSNPVEGMILPTRPIVIPNGRSHQARVELARMIREADATQKRLRREYYERRGPRTVAA